MRLAVLWPEDWSVKPVSPSLVQIDVDPTLTIRMRPALPLPAGVHTWIEGAMLENAEPNATPRLVRNEKQTSEFGWPISIAEYAFVDASGAFVEHRLGVFYRLLYNGAELVARFRERGAFEARGPDVLARFLRAGVVWPDDATGTLFELTRLE